MSATPDLLSQQDPNTPPSVPGAGQNPPGQSGTVQEDEADPQTPDEIEGYVRKTANKYGVDEDYAAEIARRENNFRHSSNGQVIKSPKGAIGAMQLMPDTAKRLGVDPYNVKENIDGGIRETKRLYDQYNGDWNKTLVGYNAGEGKVKYLQPDGTIGIKETNDYLKYTKANAELGKALREAGGATSQNQTSQTQTGQNQASPDYSDIDEALKSVNEVTQPSSTPGSSTGGAVPITGPDTSVNPSADASGSQSPSPAIQPVQLPQSSQQQNPGAVPGLDQDNSNQGLPNISPIALSHSFSDENGIKAKLIATGQISPWHDVKELAQPNAVLVPKGVATDPDTLETYVAGLFTGGDSDRVKRAIAAHRQLGNQRLFGLSSNGKELTPEEFQAYMNDPKNGPGKSVDGTQVLIPFNEADKHKIKDFIDHEFRDNHEMLASAEANPNFHPTAVDYMDLADSPKAFAVKEALKAGVKQLPGMPSVLYGLSKLLSAEQEGSLTPIGEYFKNGYYSARNVLRSAAQMVGNPDAKGLPFASLNDPDNSEASKRQGVRNVIDPSDPIHAIAAVQDMSRADRAALIATIENAKDLSSGVAGLGKYAVAGTTATALGHPEATPVIAGMMDAALALESGADAQEALYHGSKTAFNFATMEAATGGAGSLFNFGPGGEAVSAGGILAGSNAIEPHIVNHVMNAYGKLTGEPRQGKEVDDTFNAGEAVKDIAMGGLLHTITEGAGAVKELGESEKSIADGNKTSDQDRADWATARDRLQSETVSIFKQTLDSIHHDSLTPESQDALHKAVQVGDITKEDLPGVAKVLNNIKDINQPGTLAGEPDISGQDMKDAIYLYRLGAQGDLDFGKSTKALSRQYQAQDVESVYGPGMSVVESDTVDEYVRKWRSEGKSSAEIADLLPTIPDIGHKTGNFVSRIKENLPFYHALDNIKDSVNNSLNNSQDATKQDYNDTLDAIRQEIFNNGGDSGSELHLQELYNLYAEINDQRNTRFPGKLPQVSQEVSNDQQGLKEGAGQPTLGNTTVENPTIEEDATAKQRGSDIQPQATGTKGESSGRSAKNSTETIEEPETEGSEVKGEQNVSNEVSSKPDERPGSGRPESTTTDTQGGNREATPQEEVSASAAPDAAGQVSAEEGKPGQEGRPGGDNQEGDQLRGVLDDQGRTTEQRIKDANDAMDEVLKDTSPGGGYRPPPDEPSDNGLGGPGHGELKKATVPTSIKEAAPEIADNIDPKLYPELTNQESSYRAKKLMREDPVEADRVATSLDPRDNNAAGIAVKVEKLREAAAKGDIPKVKAISEALASSGITAGQSVQAFRLISKLSPEGTQAFLARTTGKARAAVEADNPSLRKSSDNTLNKIESDFAQAHADAAVEVAHKFEQDMAHDPDSPDAQPKSKLERVSQAFRDLAEKFRVRGQAALERIRGRKAVDNVKTEDYLPSLGGSLEVLYRKHGAKAADLIDYAVSKFVEHAGNKAAWAADVVKDLGDEAQPMLSNLYRRAADKFGQETKDSGITGTKQTGEGGNYGFNIKRTPLQQAGDFAKMAEEQGAKAGKKVPIEDVISKRKSPDAIKDTIGLVIGKINEAFPVKYVRTPADYVKILKQGVSRPDLYENVYNSVMDEVQKRYANDPEKLQDVEDFISQDGKLSSDSTFLKGINQFLGERNQKISSLVKEHYSKAYQAGQEFRDRLINNLALNSSEVDALKAHIDNQFQDIIAESKEKGIEQKLKEAPPPPPPKDLTTLLTEFHNLSSEHDTEGRMDLMSQYFNKVSKDPKSKFIQTLHGFLKDGGTNLSDLVRENYDTTTEAGKGLQDLLTKGIDLSPEESDHLRGLIEDKYKEIISAKKDKGIGQALKPADTSDRAAPKDLVQMLKEFSNLSNEKDSGARMDLMKQYFNKIAAGDKPRFINTLNDFLKGGGTDLGDLVKQHYRLTNQAGDEFTNMLAKQVNLSRPEADNLRSLIDNSFRENVTNKKNALVKAKFNAFQNNFDKKSGQADLTKQLIEFSNLTDMKDADTRRNLMGSYIDGKFGIPSVTPDLAKAVLDHSTKLQGLNMRIAEGIDSPATLEQLNRQANVEQATMLQKISNNQNIGTWDQKLKQIIGFGKLAGPGVVSRFGARHGSMLAMESGPTEIVQTALDKVLSPVLGQKRETFLPNYKLMATDFYKNFKYALDDAKRGIDTFQDPTKLPDPDIMKGRYSRALQAVNKYLIRPLPTAAFEAIRNQYERNIARGQGINVEDLSPEQQKLAGSRASEPVLSDENAANRFLQKLRSTFNVFGTGSLRDSITDSKASVDRFNKSEGVGLGDGLMLFSKVPGSAFMRTMDYAGLGLPRALFELARPAFTPRAEGQSYGQSIRKYEMTRALSRTIIGTGALAGLGYLASAGGHIINPNEEKDPAAANIMRNAGINAPALNWTGMYRRLTGQPNASGFQPGDRTTSLSSPYLQPWGSLFAMGHYFHQNQAQDEQHQGIADTIGHTAWNMVKSTGQTIADDPLLTGLKQKFAEMGDEKGGLGNTLGSLLKEIPSLFVPAFSNDLGKALVAGPKDTRTDTPYDAGGAITKAMDESPLRYLLPDTPTLLNQERRTPGILNKDPVETFKNLFSTKYTPSPEENYIVNLMTRMSGAKDSKSSATDMMPGFAPKSLELEDGTQRDLTPSERRTFVQFTGKQDVDAIKLMRSNPDIAQLPDQEQARVLANYIKAIHGNAQILLFGKDTAKPATDLNRATTSHLDPDYFTHNSKVDLARYRMLNDLQQGSAAKNIQGAYNQLGDREKEEALSRIGGSYNQLHIPLTTPSFGSGKDSILDLYKSALDSQDRKIWTVLRGDLKVTAVRESDPIGASYVETLKRARR